MLGAAAVHYQQTKKIPSSKWVRENGGSVFTKTFKNKDEVRACAKILRETFGDKWVARILSQTPEPMPEKELWAFAWPIDLMYDDVTDQQILQTYKNGPSRSFIDPEDSELYTVIRMTPDEFTHRINVDDCPFGQYYTRLIYTQQ